MATEKQIGFIGLGNMGLPMAHNLATYLKENSMPPLLVWSRTKSKLPEEGDLFKHAESVADITTRCDVVFSSLANDDAAASVFTKAFEALKSKEASKSIIFVETSTLYPTTAGKLEHEARNYPNVYYLQAPVFGPPVVAKKAQLLFAVSGDMHAKLLVSPLFTAMGRKALDVGSNVERASSFKLIGNFLILGSIELIAEAMTLAEKAGVGSDLCSQFLQEFMPVPTFIGYSKKIKDNRFIDQVGFTVEGGMKDASHIRRLAAESDATCQVIDTAYSHLVASKANGGGKMDWSSLVAGPRLSAGLEPFSGVKPAPVDTGFGAKFEPGQQSEEVEPVAIGPLKEVQNF